MLKLVPDAVRSSTIVFGDDLLTIEDRCMEKARIQEVVDTLPDKVDVDELIERLYLLQRLEMAEEELAAGKVPSEFVRVSGLL
jgi:hypothetical protein